MKLGRDVPASSKTMCVKFRAIPPNGGAINARNGRGRTWKSCNSTPVCPLMAKLGKYIKETNPPKDLSKERSFVIVGESGRGLWCKHVLAENKVHSHYWLQNSQPHFEWHFWANYTSEYVYFEVVECRWQCPFRIISGRSFGWKR